MVQYIDVLKLHDEFNMEELLKSLVCREKIQIAIMLANNAKLEFKRVLIFGCCFSCGFLRS